MIATKSGTGTFKKVTGIFKQAHKKHIEHDSKIYDSVIIIVRAMKEAQCEFGEGAWRLSVLLDSLKLEQNQSSKFPAIVELYDSIKHHAILEERKQLPKKQPHLF